LTAASTVIFAELHWTPAILLQAEDRAHRISQKSSVNVHYLVGENSLDSLLLRHLERKLQTTGNILNGVESKLDAELLEKGVMGKLSTPMKIEPTQKKIL
jgi:SWI/SNF-related matrix-associated actin-dependent regulator 1 of chromatin subfamily A